MSFRTDFSSLFDRKDGSRVSSDKKSEYPFKRVTISLIIVGFHCSSWGSGTAFNTVQTKGSRAQVYEFQQFARCVELSTY